MTIPNIDNCAFQRFHAHRQPNPEITQTDSSEKLSSPDDGLTRSTTRPASSLTRVHYAT